MGLVTQSWGGWAVDLVKGAAIGAGMSAAGGAALTVGVQRFGRGWWAPGSAAMTGFAVVFTYLGPVVLDPVFNRFTPLADGSTRDDVLEIAGKAGLEVGEVYEVDASRRTTAANAYVTGIGRTKRVVLYDTLLKDFTPAETRLVVAHESGTSSTATSATDCCGWRSSPHSGRSPSPAPPKGCSATARRPCRPSRSR